MKLPFSLPQFKKQDKSEYFLALLLRDEKVSAVILEEVLGKVRIVGKSEEYFKTSIEEVPEHEWLTTLDKAISKAEETLPGTVQTHKTVFGVKEEWVDELRIKHEYLAKLKKASEELELLPIGFIVINEAIVHLIQKEEGAPATAILVDIGKKNVSVSILRSGKILETKSASITGSIPYTVDEILKQVSSAEVLPARILLLDSDLGEELSQLFITYQWSKSLAFLHVPQIIVLPKGFDGRAVVFGAAKQMGFDVLEASEAQRTLSEIKEDTKTTSIEDKSAAGPAIEEKEEEQLIPQDDDGDLPFGFVRNADIIHSASHEEETVPIESPTTPVIQDNPQKLPINSFITSAREKLSKVKIPKMPALPSGNRIILLPPFLLILLIGAVVFYMFTNKATVTVAFRPSLVEEKTSVTFIQDAKGDFSKNTLSARAVEIALEGNVSTDATGKKDVGEKAKGTVTLYNSVDNKKVVPQGTVISSQNGLEFILDKDVAIASASGDIFSGTKAGTAQASVTAKTIGTEYNLPSQTKFIVDNITTLAAKNDEAFSGGSKKAVTVVDKKDVDMLISKLPKDLEHKAKEDGAGKVENDEVFVPLFTAISVIKKEFDKNVGEEAKTVKLVGVVKFTAMAYKKDEVASFAQSLLQKKLTANTILSQKGVQSSLSDMKKINGQEVGSVLAAKASLFPTVNKDELIDKIIGKSSEEATRIIQKLPQVEDIEISLSPDIPLLSDFLPRFKNNITIVIRNE